MRVRISTAGGSERAPNLRRARYRPQY